MKLTPKEKAKELIRRHYDWVDSEHEAKQNALITVDEVLNTFMPKNNKNYICDEVLYWNEVKEEINKL